MALIVRGASSPTRSVGGLDCRTMSASERAQALHYRQQVEALFDDYAPDFEASTTSTGLGSDFEAILAQAEVRGDGCSGLRCNSSAALAWWWPPWPPLQWRRLHPQASLLSLGYDIPAEIVHELQRDGAQRDAAAADAASSTISHTLAVDLGCGTGLAGAAMRPFCQGKLLGCDLSSGMLRLAKKKRGPDERRVL